MFGFLLFGPGGEFESKLESKESSAVGDFGKDCTEGCGQGNSSRRNFRYLCLGSFFLDPEDIRKLGIGGHLEICSRNRPPII